MNDYDKYSFVSQQKIDRGGHVLALCHVQRARFHAALRRDFFSFFKIGKQCESDFYHATYANTRRREKLHKVMLAFLGV